MDKNSVRSFINSLTPGTTLTINFVGNSLTDSHGVHLANSGTFTFNRKSTGRGKGGSLVMHLTAADGTQMQISTSHSDAILNLRSANGELVGYASAAEMPVVYPRDSGQAATLKEVARSLVGTSGKRVTVVSSLPHLNGTFTVQRATQLRGRNGQVVLTLVNGNDNYELWSYRHSGVVSSITVH